MKKILLVSIIIIILGISDTEAQPAKPELYRSQQFGFQISYPHNWNQREPSTGAVFTIFKKNHTAGISVNVTNFTGDKETVMRQMETKDFRNDLVSGVQRRYPGATLLHYKKTSLGNSPANLYTIQYTIMTAGSSSEIVSTQILCIYQKRAYSINLESAKVSFPGNYKEFERIVATFKFLQ